MLLKKLQALFNAERYHGWGRKKNYFEGWYYKVVNQAEDRAFAFIPGIAMDENGAQQAFVQVLDGKQLTANYHKYDFDTFSTSSERFEVNIDKNYFSNDRIQLSLPNIEGTLHFQEHAPWSNNWYSPNIMGPFSFIPFMECYHGILSMNHHIEGVLDINGEAVDFTGGRGYMEKDWGHTFPSAYFWMQTNHFSEAGISLKASIAKIPWLGSSFTGFIAGVWLKDRLIEFTTYNFTKLNKSFANQEKVILEMENTQYRLQIEALREEATGLASPIAGFMDGRVEESMNAQLKVVLYDKKNKTILLEDTGRNAGLEVAGNIEEIFV
ncbi:tocopherol cyclase family protein [Algivirga pacifica]|uniref:Tocopherol cyclase n=1 Tax=Algivirga pacifica TaxID=1162670 RepID=A0ABP9DKX6_9BACT